MKEKFKEYLTRKGIQVSDEDDNIISFEYQGLDYAFIADKDDDFYFRIVLPNIKYLDTNQLQENEKMANEFTQKYKVVKMVIFNNALWLITEQFVFSNENINYLFDRCINILKNAIDQFRNSQNIKQSHEQN